MKGVQMVSDLLDGAVSGVFVCASGSQSCRGRVPDHSSVAYRSASGTSKARV